MSYITDEYLIWYIEEKIGSYYLYDDNTYTYLFSEKASDEIMPDLEMLGLHKDKKGKGRMKAISGIIKEDNLVPGRRRRIYRQGNVRVERVPRETDERFSVYRRNADKGAPDYSPLPHDAPHKEGNSTPEDMREWCCWYAFVKMDDGTYQAVLDEAWWWGGGHNDGGTMHREIPEELFELPYEEFLGELVCLAAAAHYGFTAEMLLEREGLREFFGFPAK